MTVTRGDSSEWALVTVTFNSAEQLRNCWSTADWGQAEWIVVDNASQDDTVAVARALGARVVELDRNVGFSAANNVGLGLVESGFIAFVNPDVTVRSPTDLERLASVSLKNGGLVAPQLVYPDGSEQANGRGLPYVLDKFAHRSLRLPGSRPHEYVRSGLVNPTYVAWAMGAAMAGPAHIFRELGGWDEGFFIYYEDHDLGLRAWAAGRPIVVDPMVRWAHEWQRATTELRVTPWRHEIRSAAVFYRKYPWLLSRNSKPGVREPWRPLHERLWGEGLS